MKNVHEFEIFKKEGELYRKLKILTWDVGRDADGSMITEKKVTEDLGFYRIATADEKPVVSVLDPETFCKVGLIKI